MKSLIARLYRFQREEKAQDLLEYAMLVALIAIVSYFAVQASGSAVLAIFNDIAGKLAGLA